MATSDGPLLEAKACLGRREYAKAVEQASDAILAAPKDAVAYTLRAEALRKLGQPDRALADVAVAIRIDPDRASPFVIRAEILKKRCQFDQAIADATQAIFLQPDNAAAFSIRADCRRSIGDADGAAFDAHEVFRIDPTRPPSTPASNPTPAKGIPGTTARDHKRAGGVAPGRDDSVLADGNAVDRSLKARKPISSDDAAEILADGSGYKPKIIARTLPRARSSRSEPKTPALPIVAAILACVVLGMGVLLMKGQPKSRVLTPPSAELAASQPLIQVPGPTHPREGLPPEPPRSLDGQGTRKEGLNVRRLRVSVSETGECGVIVDEGEAGVVRVSKEGGLTLAGVSDAQVARGEDGRLTITHRFREAKGLSDFARLAGSVPQVLQGVSLDRGDGRLILTPVPAPGEPGKKAVLGYPRYLKPPIAVTIDLDEVPAASTLVVQFEKLQPDEKLAVRVGENPAKKGTIWLNATWHPRDRKKMVTLFDRAIEPSKPDGESEHKFQLPPDAIAANDRIALKFGYYGPAPAAIGSLEVEARVVPSFGVISMNPNGPMILKSLVKGTPAERAGLRQGDIVESIRGTKVRDNSEGVALLAQTPVGENVKIVVRRGGKTTEFTLRAE